MAQQTRTDQQLVRAFVGGDTSAFSTIVERHRKRLQMVARKYANNEHDVQDIMQEAFLRASMNLRTYRAECGLSTWLHRLVMNSGFDHLNRRCRVETPSIDAEIIPHETNLLLSHDPANNIERSILLRQAMSHLRQEQQMAIVLTDIAGYSIADVARHQGVQPGTIKSRRARARQTLRAVVS